MQKLYCYVDETGQDIDSELFIVVAIVSDQDQEHLRERLIRFEDLSRTGHRKWHKIQPQKRLKFLKEVIAQKLGHGEVFFRAYLKPIPYFFPTIDVIELSILQKTTLPYITKVYVDGIDQKKALELTGALRARGISLELVRSRRDESEPLIRLADMWAGCIRAARAGRVPEKMLLNTALSSGYMEELQPPKQKTLEIKG